MNKAKGLAHMKINNSTVKRILLQLDKCRKGRLHTLKGLPGDYKLKDLRIRENEVNTIYDLMKARIEKQFVKHAVSEAEVKDE